MKTKGTRKRRTGKLKIVGKKISNIDGFSSSGKVHATYKKMQGVIDSEKDFNSTHK